jgi:hypothetical protein
MYRVNTVRKAINRNHWTGRIRLKRGRGLTERKWMLNNEGGGAVMEA